MKQLTPLSYFDVEKDLQDWIENNEEQVCSILEDVIKAKDLWLYKREAVLNLVGTPYNQKRVDFWFRGDLVEILVETKNPTATVDDLQQILEYMDLMEQRKKAIYDKASKEVKEQFDKHKIIGVLLAPHITDNLFRTVRFMRNVYAIESTRWTYAGRQ